MKFHPRMFSKVQGFHPIKRVDSLSVPGAVLDYWQVDTRLGARGWYVSMHPRLVFLMENQKLLLQRSAEEPPQQTAACFIPAGMEKRSGVEKTGTIRHLDVHLPHKTLRAILGPDASLRAPIWFPSLGRLGSLVELLAQECAAPVRERARQPQSGQSSALPSTGVESSDR